MKARVDSYTSRRFHIVLDAFGCEEKKLSDKKAISSLILKLASLVDMKILAGPIVVDGIPENPGVTAFAIIDFSHISIHTFTKNGEFCLDVFSCKYFDSQKVINFVKEYFSLLDNNIYSSVVRYDQMNINRTFDTFSPEKYLKEYYRVLSRENKDILNWYNKIYSKMKSDSYKLLEVGGGPTVYQLLSAANKVKSITFTDYSENNLDKIRDWQKNNSQAFQWDDFTRYVLSLEDKPKGGSEVEERSKLLRKKITSIEPLNLNNLNDKLVDSFDIVQSNFCPESATDDITEYKNMLDNIHSYLKPKGILLMTALEGAIVYKSGDSYFPAIYLDEDFAQKYLSEAGFRILSISKKNSEKPSESKYHGILFIEAEKP